jgi:hypothetical protein
MNRLTCIAVGGFLAGFLVGCGDEPSTEGGCQLYAIATLPGGDLIANGIDENVTPAIGRDGATSAWRRGVGFPTRGFAVSPDRIAHLGGTGTLAVADTTGTRIFQESLGSEATCEGCGGVVFVGDLAVLWQGSIRWFDSDGTAAAQTSIPVVTDTAGWCACSLGAHASGDLLVGGIDPGADTLVTHVQRLSRDGTLVWRWTSDPGVYASVVGLPDSGALVYGLKLPEAGGSDGWIGWLDDDGVLLRSQEFTEGNSAVIQTVARNTDGATLLGIQADYSTATETRTLRHLLALDEFGTVSDAQSPELWSSLSSFPGGITTSGREAVVPVERAWNVLGCSSPVGYEAYPGL